MTTLRESPVRILTALFLFACLEPQSRAQVFDYDLQGSTKGDDFGWALNRIGDLDLDGCEDFIVGAPYFGSSNVGKATVYSGSAGVEIASLSGNNQSFLGGSVDGKIDSDGDGYPDVIVGASADSSSATNGGRVVVFSPQRNKILVDLIGGNMNGLLGQAVRSLQSDLDGDGVNDFIAGAPGIDKTYVYSGATGAVIYTHSGQSGAYSGMSVSNGGDMNGDGIHDYLIGAPSYVDSLGNTTGRVTAWSGKDGSQLWGIDGPAAGSEFGWSIGHPGDLDGDGLGDCVVGAPNYADLSGAVTGAVYAISGASGTTLYTVYGDNNNDWLGSSVQTVGGDIDDDGTTDFISGAPAYAGGKGYARLFSGATGNVLFTYHVMTPDPGVYTNYGSAVGGGDVDGDGRTDVIIGGLLFDFNPSTWHGRGIVETWITAVAKWFTYGNGWPGTNGVPLLTAVSDPVVGQSLSLTLQDSAGANTTGMLLIGVKAAAIPTSKGGTLLVDPIFYVPVSVPSGGLTLTGSIPSDPSLYGFNLHLQALEVDAGASKGVSFTPGLDLYLGFD
jgi:FG-GAP repeat protein